MHEELIAALKCGGMNKKLQRWKVSVLCEGKEKRLL